MALTSSRVCRRLWDHFDYGVWGNRAGLARSWKAHRHLGSGGEGLDQGWRLKVFASSPQRNSPTFSSLFPPVTSHWWSTTFTDLPLPANLFSVSPLTLSLTQPVSFENKPRWSLTEASAFQCLGNPSLLHPSLNHSGLVTHKIIKFRINKQNRQPGYPVKMWIADKQWIYFILV